MAPARGVAAAHPLILAVMAKTDEVVPIYLAMVFARIGDFDRALEYLRIWRSVGISPAISFLAEYNRFLVPLRGHPRFEALVEKARAQARAFPGAT